jgi:hypothetical protein
MNVRRTIHMSIVAVLRGATAPAVSEPAPRAHVASSAERRHVPLQEAEVQYIAGGRGRPRRCYDHQHSGYRCPLTGIIPTNHAIFGGLKLLVASTSAV